MSVTLLTGVKFRFDDLSKVLEIAIPADFISMKPGQFGFSVAVLANRFAVGHWYFLSPCWLISAAYGLIAADGR
jgi:hypothetical protein